MLQWVSKFSVKIWLTMMYGKWSLKEKASRNENNVLVWCNVHMQAYPLNESSPSAQSTERFIVLRFLLAALEKLLCIFALFSASQRKNRHKKTPIRRRRWSLILRLNDNTNWQSVARFVKNRLLHRSASVFHRGWRTALFKKKVIYIARSDNLWIR